MGGHTPMGHGAQNGRRGRRGITALLVATMAVSLMAVGTVGSPAGAAVLGSARTAVLGKADNAGTLTVETPGVTVLKKGENTFVKAKSNMKIKTGDTVQTDATGFAQIAFPDGSITRLDNSSVFTLDKLSTKVGERQVEGTLSAGQTWNRVQKLSENESFQQGNGNGATAAVLGTAFVTKCELPAGGAAFKVVKTKKSLKRLKKATKNCDFTLIDGKLKLTAANKVVDINRGQQIDTTGGDAGDPTTYPPDIVFTDKWILRNLGADAAAGISEASGTPTADDLKHARIEGSWPVTLTVNESGGARNLGGSLSRTYTFAGDCSGGGACKVTLSRQTAKGTEVIPLTYADGVYSGAVADMGTQDCVLDNGTVAVPNGLRNSGTVSFSPTAARAADGLWIATALAGTVTETTTQIAGAAGQCEAGTATFSLSASR